MKMHLWSSYMLVIGAILCACASEKQVGLAEKLKRCRANLFMRAIRGCASVQAIDQPETLNSFTNLLLHSKVVRAALCPPLATADAKRSTDVFDGSCLCNPTRFTDARVCKVADALLSTGGEQSLVAKRRWAAPGGRHLCPRGTTKSCHQWGCMCVRY